MTTLNDIPEALRSARETQWTPRRGLVKGTVCTFLATVVFGVLLCAVTYYAPRMTMHWALSGALAFVTTWLLCEVMQRAAGMACLSGTLIVAVLAILLIVAKHLAWLAHVIESHGATASLWSSFDIGEMVCANSSAWIGLTLAALICRNGDSSLHDLADLLMTNPITGSRV